jgi:hypothetical protein
VATGENVTIAAARLTVRFTHAAVAAPHPNPPPQAGEGEGRIKPRLTTPADAPTGPLKLC